jgi:hypothetical protein
MAIPNAYFETVPGDVSSFDTYGDLTALQFTFVSLYGSADRTVQAWTSGMPVGVLINKPTASPTYLKQTNVAQVQTRGFAKVKVGSGGVTAGQLVKLAAGGVVVTATPTDKDIIVGQCVVGGAVGLYATIQLFLTYASV